MANLKEDYSPSDINSIEDIVDLYNEAQEQVNIFKNNVNVFNFNIEKIKESNVEEQFYIYRNFLNKVNDFLDKKTVSIYGNHPSINSNEYNIIKGFITFVEENN